jgi:hypothetical protein
MLLLCCLGLSPTLTDARERIPTAPNAFFPSHFGTANANNEYKAQKDL